MKETKKKDVLYNGEYSIENFADTLKNYRITNGLTQEELAKRLGTTKQVISNYENAKHSPKVEVARNIASAIGIPISTMLGADDHDYGEEQLLCYYRSLSDEGKEKLLERAAEMVFVYGKKNKKTSVREEAL